MENIKLIPTAAKYISNKSDCSANSRCLGIGTKSPDFKYRVLLNFRLDNLWDCTEIDNAYLKMFAKSFEENKQATITPFLIVSEWDEKTVNWGSQPYIDTHITGDSVIVSKSGWYEWRITDIVKAWVGKKHCNYGIMLKSKEISCNKLKLFYTVRSSHCKELSPILEIKFKSKLRTCLYERKAVSIIEEHRARWNHHYTDWIDCSSYGKSTYYVQNVGLSNALVNVQVSPDKSTTVDEEARYIIAPNITRAITPLKFSYYCRLAYRTETSESKTELKIWFQAQV